MSYFRKRRNRGVFHNVGDILFKTVCSTRAGTRLKLFCLWNETVGGPVSKVAQPVDFRDQTLFISVRDSVWVRQLKFLEGMILQKLNKQVGAERVTKLYFSVSGNQNLQRFKKGVEVDNENIYKQKIKEMAGPAEEDIDSIADEEIRQVFLRIRLKLLDMQNVHD
ncbi:MAG: DUF721 domain-containing protein [Nitrospinota bacterium]